METAKVKYQRKNPRRNSPIIQVVIPNPDDFKLIKQAIEKTGMNTSSFIRLHVLQAARQIVSK